MTVDAPLLGRLRRSVLGAWLAVAYALTLLAAGLAPAPAGAHNVFDGAVLCSGLALPGESAGTPAQEPTGEVLHCKGCPLGPVFACPSRPTHIGVVRMAAAVSAEILHAQAAAPSSILGLPPSRAPPAAPTLI
ncbi:hypothetical protein ASE63_19690 [Bosea sp. Root381]|uniref:hypothetical protein n=1 Tax=Bosea sp. Root381 TaxID=1736524 RepID=UPI0007006EEF|nr:hypothetical protein [Bosea sp. Root381]KRE11959.1 hypothetical protein ASE63_19690 [Bosea sp. Root381]